MTDEDRERLHLLARGIPAAVLAELDEMHPFEGGGPGCVAWSEGQMCCVDFMLEEYRAHA